ncbi:MAG: NAD(P)/FAD-dependent oxidoreductase [Frankiaceae bacterium]|nr:NAD(P)/FAD-dependent oxidoreductase [Frankiaceae bacterium]
MTRRVAVVGAGAGGIAMGVALKRAGYEFTIFDGADGFGGTWRHNTYPGAACDVPSHLYSFSFALNPRWSKTYATQPEILAYLEGVARHHGLDEHLRAGTRVGSAAWSDERQSWTVTTASGSVETFDVIVTAVGMLDIPNIPHIPGIERFRGRVFHSSRWDHSRSVTGERVGSIGTGASAIQYVPAIARDVLSLTVFQRTPIWVSPRFDEPFTDEQMRTFTDQPEQMQALRDYIWQQYEDASFDAGDEQTRKATELARSYLHRKVHDPDLRAKLTPAYPVGCKRPLLSRDWFPTLTAPHVRLVTVGVSEYTEAGLLTADGEEHELDTVIYGTGFTAADYLSSLSITGTAGRTLHDEWSDGAEAYLGTTVSGYPNLFTLYGPNTNGVNSILYIHEAQVRYVMSALDLLAESGARSIDVKAQVQADYNQRLQDAMHGTVWLANCNNYYRHPSGKVVTQLPYSGGEFARRTQRVDPADYDLT